VKYWKVLKKLDEKTDWLEYNLASNFRTENYSNPFNRQLAGITMSSIFTGIPRTLFDEFDQKIKNIYIPMAIKINNTL